jgi:hypothetical protein
MPMFYMDSDDVEALIALVEEKIQQRYGQDPTIGAIHRLGDLGDKGAVPVLTRRLTPRQPWGQRECQDRFVQT